MMLPRWRKGKQVKGSFTVEAAFLCPLIVLLTAFFLQTAITMYEKTNRVSQDLTTVQETDSLQIFLFKTGTQDFKETIFQE